jgi:hypothetical protein
VRWIDAANEDAATFLPIIRAAPLRCVMALARRWRWAVMIGARRMAAIWAGSASPEPSPSHQSNISPNWQHICIASADWFFGGERDAAYNALFQHDESVCGHRSRWTNHPDYRVRSKALVCREI